MESPFNFLAMSGISIGATSIAADFVSFIWFSALFPKSFVKYFHVAKPDFQPSGDQIRKSILGSFIAKIIFTIVYAILLHTLNNVTIGAALKLILILVLGFSATVWLKEVIWHNECDSFMS